MPTLAAAVVVACVPSETPRNAKNPEPTTRHPTRTGDAGNAQQPPSTSLPPIDTQLGHACPPGADPPADEDQIQRSDWSAEQWLWKRRLCWSWECDYVADVSVVAVNQSEQLVQIMCVPGSYQPMYYLFSYNADTGEKVQLELGHEETTDDPREVWGHVTFDQPTKTLKILSLARGTGDCGLLRSFQLTGGKLQLVETRGRDCPEQGQPQQADTPPEEWPLVDK